VTPVFLDTVGLIAAWERADQWHAAASAVLGTLLRSGIPVVTTPHVLLECGNACARRPCRADVSQLRRDLIQAGRLIEPTSSEVEDAWEAYARGEAGRAGVVDHISFLVMRRLGLTQAFTNDAHFRAAGFETLF
jgi:predicted nucleic acid-binding protein